RARDLFEHSRRRSRTARRLPGTQRAARTDPPGHLSLQHDRQRLSAGAAQSGSGDAAGEVDGALQRYPEATPALRGEIGNYWKVLGLMREVAEKRGSPGVDAYFRKQLAGRRETMLRIAGDAGAALDR